MKIIIPFTILLATSAFFSSIFLTQYNSNDNLDIDNLWSTWKMTHKKIYNTTSEEMLRKAIFESNLEKINLHNSDPT